MSLRSALRDGDRTVRGLQGYLVIGNQIRLRRISSNDVDGNVRMSRANSNSLLTVDAIEENCSKSFIELTTRMKHRHERPSLYALRMGFLEPHATSIGNPTRPRGRSGQFVFDFLE